MLGSGLRSFSELAGKIDLLPDQTPGNGNGPVCETGEKYVEFFEYGIARPGDESFVEELIAERMWRSLSEYFKGKTGRIYWRVRFESEIKDYAVILKIDENGPDVDFLTDKRCVKDKNWKSISCYCRLFRAQLPLNAD